MKDVIKWLIGAVVILGLVYLSSCANTANGLGQLLEGMGDDIQQMSESQRK